MEIDGLERMDAVILVYGIINQAYNDLTKGESVFTKPEHVADARQFFIDGRYERLKKVLAELGIRQGMLEERFEKNLESYLREGLC